MSVVLPKSYLYQILFALCVSVPYLDNYELTFAVWIFAAVVTVSKKYSFGLIKYALCFAGILTIAFISMLFHKGDYSAYYIVRDATYLVKPIMGLMIGYQICKGNFKHTFQTIVYTGAFIAIIHLFTVAYAVIALHATTVNDIRLRAGMFSDFEIYALIIVIFHRKFELGFTQRKIRYLAILIGISCFLYMARTNFIQFIILYLAMKGYLKINRTSITVISTVIIASVIGYSTILYINPKRNGPGMEALLYKIKVAPIEPFKTKIDVNNWKDFNDNYRSYENIRTVKQVTSGGNQSIAIGLGLGSKIDLKRKIWLRENLRYISILHNGFMTVFLKSGLLGISLSLLSIFLLFRQKASKIPIIGNINLLLVGTGVFLIISNWVFMGLYNLLDSKSILIGLLFCYKEITIKRNASLIEEEA